MSGGGDTCPTPLTITSISPVRSFSSSAASAASATVMEMGRWPRETSSMAAGTSSISVTGVPPIKSGPS